MTRSDEELLALMEEGMREMEVSCQSNALQQNLGPPQGVSYSGQSTFTSNHCSAYPSPSTWTGRQDLANQIPDGSEYHSDHENVQQSLTGEDYPSGFPISTGLPRKMSRSAPSKTVKTPIKDHKQALPHTKGCIKYSSVIYHQIHASKKG